MDVGDKIRYVRELRDLTLAELSNLSGVSASYISDVENHRSNMSIKSLKKIAKALHVDPSFFLDDKAITLDVLANIKGYELPREIRDYVSKEDSLPYIVLAKELEEEGIAPDIIKMLVEHYKEVLRNKS